MLFRCHREISGVSRVVQDEGFLKVKPAFLDILCIYPIRRNIFGCLSAHECACLIAATHLDRITNDEERRASTNPLLDLFDQDELNELTMIPNYSITFFSPHLKYILERATNPCVGNDVPFDLYEGKKTMVVWTFGCLKTSKWMRLQHREGNLEHDGQHVTADADFPYLPGDWENVDSPKFAKYRGSLARRKTRIPAPDITLLDISHCLCATVSPLHDGKDICFYPAGHENDAAWIFRLFWEPPRRRERTHRKVFGQMRDKKPMYYLELDMPHSLSLLAESMLTTNRPDHWDIDWLTAVRFARLYTERTTSDVMHNISKCIISTRLLTTSEWNYIEDQYGIWSNLVIAMDYKRKCIDR